MLVKKDGVDGQVLDLDTAVKDGVLGCGVGGGLGFGGFGLWCWWWVVR